VPRFVVLEPGPEDPDPFAAELATGGARVVHGWDVRIVPGEPPPVCVGRVTGPEDAARAVLAAVAGARLVVTTGADRDLVDQLVDDLRRLGEVDHRVGRSPGPTLSDDQRALLAHLLSGATLGGAARHLHLSRRTADRRLAAARTALGARTTAEALSAAARLGIRPARD
jgi:DNA-binding NarL/FixJ family response regulator